MDSLSPARGRVQGLATGGAELEVIEAAAAGDCMRVEPAAITGLPPADSRWDDLLKIRCLDKLSLKKIIKENDLRNQRLNREFDPVKGVGCSGERVAVGAKPYNDGVARVPQEMLFDPLYPTATSRQAWVRLRCRHDFEYWAAMCATVRDKSTGRDIPFRLNAPQRRVAAILEADRRAGLPLRVIMLKARQWGGSTLVQLYMAWIQTVLRENWNSLICGHVKDAAANIRAMYTKLLKSYPADFWDGDEAPQFRPMEGSSNIRLIQGRGCRVTLGTSESPDSARGGDYQMAHLSEVAFWRDGPGNNSEGLVRAVCGSINSTPMTLIVMESTANGVGNYFHREWLRSVDGLSDKRAVFVGWNEIEIYRCRCDDPARLWAGLDDYERNLWRQGLTLEMIEWFHRKRREYPTLQQMQAEYPLVPDEAFLATDKAVFSAAEIDGVRADCREPLFRGELAGTMPAGQLSLEGLRLVGADKGCLAIWSYPDSADGHYVVAVDIGGRTAAADWTVVTVIDRHGGDDGESLEVVAQWRGHADHDIAAWKSVQIARFYNDALLVFESNTLESELTDGDPSAYILNQVGNFYRNLYWRQGPDGSCRRPGFHMNRATKTAIVADLIATVRDHRYVERDAGAADELAVFEMSPSGSYAAAPGAHDDRVVSRGIAIHVALNAPDNSPASSLESYLRTLRRY